LFLPLLGQIVRLSWKLFRLQPRVVNRAGFGFGPNFEELSGRIRAQNAELPDISAIFFPVASDSVLANAKANRAKSDEFALVGIFFLL